MSMFHELMMRKKEEIMYATIKGTLTESPEGVFSGFSASNYLTLQQTISINQDTNFELVEKINITTIDQSSSFMGTMDSVGLAFRISGTGKLAFYLGDGNSWIVNALTGITTFSTNTDYYVKVSINNGVITTYSSIDGKVWTQEATTTVTFSQTYNYVISLGTGRISSSYFKGSIDLNNSYIKIGSTKYKLQAVVGYTVVGSPTITDGVVSGFSSANYLQIQKSLNITKNQDFEFCTVFSIQTLDSTFCYLVQTSDTYSFYIDFQSSRIRFRFANEDNTTQVNNIYFNFAANTKYKVKWKYIALTNTHIFTLEQNNNIIGEAQSIFIPKTINLPILYGKDNTNLKNIYMNETYIKSNNKLWFNGQQA